MLHGLRKLARLRSRVLELGRQAEQTLRHWNVALVQPAQLAGPLRRRRRDLARSSPLPRECLVDLSAAPGDGLGMLGRGQPGLDLRGLARAEPCGGDLRGLVVLQLETAGQLARIQRQFRQSGLIPAPGLHGRGHGRALAFQAAERIEQLTLPALVEESLLIVLAVDLDEAPGDLRKVGGRDRFVVDSSR